MWLMSDLRAGTPFLIPNCRNLPLLSRWGFNAPRITLRLHVESCMPSTLSPAEPRDCVPGTLSPAEPWGCVSGTLSPAGQMGAGGKAASCGQGAAR